MADGCRVDDLPNADECEGAFATRQPRRRRSEAGRPSIAAAADCRLAAPRSLGHRMRHRCGRSCRLTPLYVKNARGSTTARSVRGELKALASLGSRSPRTVNHGRQPAARVLRCAPALRVTAAADRAGSPCGPAGRLALDPLPGSATPASHSVVAENRRQTPEWDRVHLPDRGFAVARTIRKHAVGILAYLDTRMTERARGRTHPARPTG